MSKEYKGYELIKAIEEGEIEENTEISVIRHEEYETTIKVGQDKGLIWDTGEFNTSFLTDNDVIFHIEEQDVVIRYIQEIDMSMRQYEEVETINKLIKAVKQLDKKIREKE